MVSFNNAPEVRFLSSTGITRRLQYYEPVRHPKRPGLLLTEFRLRATTSHHKGLPVFRRFPLPCMPTPLPRRNRWMLSLSCPTTTAFPENQTGRLPHYPFRGLLSVHSRSGLHVRSITRGDLYTEYFTTFVTSCGALVASGRATDWPGGIRTH